LVHLGKEVK